MATIGSLIVNLVANTGPFASAIKKAKAEVQLFASTSKAAMATFSGAMGALGVTVGAGFLFKEVVQSALEAESVMAQLNATIKATGGAAGFTSSEIDKLSLDLQNVTKFSDEATKQGAALLMTFGNIKGDVFLKAITAAMDLATLKSMDLASAVTMVGKALNNPAEGFGRLSKTIGVLTAEQKAQIQAFIDSGDVMGAQLAILGALEDKMGGSAAAAAETYAGKIEILKNKFNDLEETSGKALINLLEFRKWTIEDITRWIAEKIVPPGESDTSGNAWGEEAVKATADLSKQIAKENAALQMQNADDVFDLEKKHAQELADFSRQVAEENKALMMQAADDELTLKKQAAEKAKEFNKQVAEENAALQMQAAEDAANMPKAREEMIKRFFDSREAAMQQSAGAKFLERGSSEAISAINASRNDPLANLGQTAKEQLIAQLELNRLWKADQDKKNADTLVTIGG